MASLLACLLGQQARLRGLATASLLDQLDALAGLDLDYESFSGSDNFVTCISGLISNIKGSGAACLLAR